MPTRSVDILSKNGKIIKLYSFLHYLDYIIKLDVMGNLSDYVRHNVFFK